MKIRWVSIGEGSRCYWLKKKLKHSPDIQWLKSNQSGLQKTEFGTLWIAWTRCKLLGNQSIIRSKKYRSQISVMSGKRTKDKRLVTHIISNWYVEYLSGCYVTNTEFLFWIGLLFFLATRGDKTDFGKFISDHPYLIFGGWFLALTIWSLSF